MNSSPTTAIEWDVFISHASEDKGSVARPLANTLAAAGIKTWLDESELRLGDSLREKIDAGLLRSQFGVVVLSPSFFAKHWPRSELDGLLSRESQSTKVVLPVWHDVDAALVRTYSPILAGRLAASTANGLEEVANKIADAIRAVGRTRRTSAPAYAGIMTKRRLMQLPAGYVIFSNIVNHDLTPAFLETLGMPPAREALWQRIRSVRGRWYVFEDMAHAREHLESRHQYVTDRLRQPSA